VVVIAPSETLAPSIRERRRGAARADRSPKAEPERKRDRAGGSRIAAGGEADVLRRAAGADAGDGIAAEGIEACRCRG
jgi:hypothetical protein